MAVLLAGCGVKGGAVYGTTDATGAAPDADLCSPGDVSATVLSLLGIDPVREARTPSGRPAPVFREGEVIDELIS